jgi:hypothetical protein
MAGILPLNYARGRRNRLYHAIIKGYAYPVKTWIERFQATGRRFRAGRDNGTANQTLSNPSRSTGLAQPSWPV